ncbi:hypothetical protein CLHOM_03370 [Clostridium homopropionicum DSM 5847]|uniref:DUF3784 domain-containing protein n=1 Tax=Clostridium homopropionicum DSM 5847 TaxID=1121318 RepID=A0A0L6ZE41_9CLOT|nr:hypothetical protein [Clostridium homopropionicum]KOA21207.1 hypothetical protein CLHOM_03370 [Clostridium homopropionicum DSM 5847]SFG27295.1 hypothetical protein SAMN04488501_10781 [Clostridium homopropionicum]
MDVAMNYALVALGIIEIVLGINMDKFTRNKYSSQKVKDIEGLIKWEKFTSIILGICILIMAFVGLMGSYEQYSNIFIMIILALLIITFFGKRRFI